MDVIEANRSRTMLVGTVVGAAAVGCFAAVFYEAYVPGHVEEVTGSVVTREVFADDQTPPRHFIYVNLDGGATVRARTDRFVTTMPGDHVVLVRIETPLLGAHRYRYKRHVDRQRKVAAPAERITP